MWQRRKVIGPLLAAVSILSLAGLWSAFAEQPASVATANADTAAKTVGEAVASYRLGPGDRIRITVFDEKDLSGTFEVASDRTVALPLIGSVKAGGLTVRELELAIGAVLRDGYLKEPRVSAEVANYRPFYIIGEVNRPGSYPYINNMTVINAVALGGGFTYRARQRTAFLTRAADPERKEQPVATDSIVMPGDVIRVPERFF